jgi:flagellar motility protein MotE (MotC chaperone)
MRPPNLFWIRKFNERGKSSQGNNRQLIDNEEIRNVVNEITDMLAYVLELENQVEDLKKQANNNEVIEVVMEGKNF